MRRSVLGLLVLTPLLYGLTWQIETVENEPVREFSFALDRYDYPWILFERDSTLYLKYWDSSEWKTEVIDTVLTKSPRISIRGDEIWIAASKSKNLYGYHRVNENWAQALVDTATEVLDLVVDQNGFPHICYYALEKGLGYSKNKHFKYATLSDDLWRIEYIDTFPIVYKHCYPSITLDRDNRPHTVFMAALYGPGSLMGYAFRDEGGWHIEPIPPGDGPNSGTGYSIVLDKEGKVHVTTLPVTFGLVHTWQEDTSWRWEQIDSTSYTGNGDIRFDLEGTLHLAYIHYDFVNPPILFYAIRADTGWIKEQVDTGDMGWELCDMELDSLGYPHIVYPTASGLNYARGRPSSGEVENKPSDRESIRFSISPNLSKSSFSIHYSLPEKTHISITVYNSSGQLTKTLVDEVRESGTYTIEWDGRDGRGSPLPKGIYFCRLEAFGSTCVKKMILVK